MIKSRRRFLQLCGTAVSGSLLVRWRGCFAANDVGPARVRRMPMPAPGEGPAGKMKHLTFEPGPNGRIYVFGGDYFGRPPGASYRREVWSVDLEANDWRLEAGYCPPSAEVTWDRGRCQAGLAHLGGERFLVVGGNYGLNNSGACDAPASGIREAYVMEWDGSYRIPEQTPQNPERDLGGPFGQIKYGVWDPERERFLAIKGHGQIADFRNGEWRLIPGATGGYLWSAQGSQNIVARRWYMIDEKAGDHGRLLYMDLDTNRLYTAADLPFPARRRRNSYETTTVAWWGARERLALYRNYDRGMIWLHEIDGGFQRLDLPGPAAEAYGNHLVADPAHGALAIIGRNDGAWNDFDRSYWLIH